MRGQSADATRAAGELSKGSKQSHEGARREALQGACVKLPAYRAVLSRGESCPQTVPRKDIRKLVAQQQRHQLIGLHND